MNQFKYLTFSVKQCCVRLPDLCAGSLILCCIELSYSLVYGIGKCQELDSIINKARNSSRLHSANVLVIRHRTACHVGIVSE